MKNHFSKSLSFVLLIAIILSPAIVHCQYKFINPDIEGIYLCETIEESLDSYRSRSTLDSQKNGTAVDVFYPYRTLTDLNYQSSGCNLIYTNNWLGDSIIHEINSDSYIFHFTPIRNINPDFGFELSTPESFRIPGGLNIGSKFFIGAFIEAEVISETVDSWNGLQLEKQTIRLTNSGNVDYNWNTEVIVLTKDHGVYNFPNLQYFPFEWKNVTLAGITQGGIGLQDISSKDTYRMSPGDEYTAENRLTYVGPPSIYYDRIKCLSIIDENDNYQLRLIQKEKLLRNYNTFQWEYSIDTIEENVIYDEQGIVGRANETINRGELNKSLVIIRENGYKYLNDYHSSEQAVHCYRELIDGCTNYFTFKGAFTIYNDCSGIFAFESFYLPVHRIFDGEEFGDGEVFDSIKTLKSKIIDISNVEIYPNPSNGGFILELPDNLQFDHFMITGLSGQTITLKPISVDNKRINFRQTYVPGIYILHGIDNNGKHYQLGKLIIK